VRSTSGRPLTRPLTLQCSVGQADLAVGGDVRPFVLTFARPGLVSRLRFPSGSVRLLGSHAAAVSAVGRLDQPTETSAAGFGVGDR
jgi:hypothetical protein